MGFRIFAFKTVPFENVCKAFASLAELFILSLPF